MKIKQKVFKRLEEEAKRSGLELRQFVESLDKAAVRNLGECWSYGLITGLSAQASNIETVCRYIREWRRINRHK